MKSLNKIIIFFSLLIPMTAFALDVGNVKVHSELYESLNADVQLTDITGISAKQLRISPAPASAYYLRGVAFDPVINRMNFTVKHVNGNQVMSITSPEPITEPVLNFLVQFQWPKGEVIKKITLLPQLPGQGDETPLVVKKSDAMNDINQDINSLKSSAEKMWQKTINKIIYLTNQYNRSS